MMKANEIRKMSAAELEAKLVELKKDLFMLRMQHPRRKAHFQAGTGAR